MKIFLALWITGFIANAFSYYGDGHEKSGSGAYADSTIVLPLGGNTWAENAPGKTKIITTRETG
jgi:hypothetical protein